jgi:hypothetical protein
MILRFMILIWSLTPGRKNMTVKIMEVIEWIHDGYEEVFHAIGPD